MSTDFRIGVLAQMSNPPKPLGFDVFDGNTWLASLTHEQVKEALRRYEEMMTTLGDSTMAKIVYNACHGGFGLSNKAMTRYRELGGTAHYNEDISRSDPRLIQVLDELGKEANGPYANLQIADVPSGTKYRIDEYDGSERIMTIDDYEWQVAP
jgi:hypothetical protein